MNKTFFLLFAIFLSVSSNSFSQDVKMDELLQILKINTCRLPSFSGKRWNIEIIADTLDVTKLATVSKALLPKHTDLLVFQIQPDGWFFCQESCYGFGGYAGQNYRINSDDPYQVWHGMIWYDAPKRLNNQYYVLGELYYARVNDDNAKQTKLIIARFISLN